MHRKTLLALLGAILITVAATGAALAASAGPAVTVRVEGVKKTLLQPTSVHARTGWITRFGAPSGQCRARSGAGALDVATRHRWGGTWSSQFAEYEITSVLGETHTFSSKYYWEILVDNKVASTGPCEIKLRQGEQLLFAAVPNSLRTVWYPLALQGPLQAPRGKQLR